MNRRIALILLGGAVAGVLIGVALAGGDSGSDRQPSLPELGIPRTEPPAAETGPTGPTDTVEPAPDSGTGGDTGADTGGTPPAGEQDTETNDTPPPEGSPAERFENFCDQNPGAC